MQDENQRVVVYSTYSDDILLSEKGEPISVQAGGPALFIKQALNKHSLQYRLIAGDRVRVQIRITDHGECSKIDPIQLNVVRDSDATAVLVSTILREWPISIARDNRITFIDIQGYVRDGDVFGKKKFFAIPEGIKPFCIKGTEEEISYLSTDFLDEQRENRCLIVTKGSRGAELFHRNEQYIVTPLEIIKAKDTIGAGDTFFAHFFAYYLATQDIKLSGESATREVVTFLRKKEK